jgi:hypothetical protein
MRITMMMTKRTTTVDYDDIDKNDTATREIIMVHLKMKIGWCTHPVVVEWLSFEGWLDMI